MSSTARIYIRRNGALGASCGTVADTGHTILEDSGKFTVFADGEDEPIIRDASREQAEKAIAADWTGQP